MPRFLWVWERATRRLLSDSVARGSTLAALEEAGVAAIYLYAGAALLREQATTYRRLVAVLHARGIGSYALLWSEECAAHYWVLPRWRAVARRALAALGEYQLAAPAAGRFDGLMLDVEPYLLPAWGPATPELSGLYLDLLQEVRSACRQGLSGLPLGAAVPFWWQQREALRWRGRRRTLGAHALELLDVAVVLAYRRQAGGEDGMVALARPTLLSADTRGKRVVVGIETAPATPAKVSFHGSAAGALRRELAAAARALSAHPSFGGFAIHHLRAPTLGAGVGNGGVPG